MNWGNFFLVLSLIPAFGFPILYMLTAKWWRTWLGWALWYTGMTLMLLYGLAGANLAWGPEFPGKQALRGVLFFMAFTFLWVLFIGYIVTWFKQRAERRAQKLKSEETSE